MNVNTIQIVIYYLQLCMITTKPQTQQHIVLMIKCIITRYRSICNKCIESLRYHFFPLVSAQ